MSIISNFGFSTETDEEFNQFLDMVFESGKSIKTDQGNYLCYYDGSGAEVWIQGTKDYDILNVSAKFNGKSTKSVNLDTLIEQKQNPMDAHYHAWAKPTEAGNPECGIYPFMFNVPDFRIRPTPELPYNCSVQLTAAPFELDYFETSEAFKASQDKGQQRALPSFIPNGLFVDEKLDEEPQPLANFAGIIEESAHYTNELTEEPFYWILVDTLGGTVDVVAKPTFFDGLPQPGGIIQGEFWLSGKLLQE